MNSSCSQLFLKCYRNVGIEMLIIYGIGEFRANNTTKDRKLFLTKYQKKNSFLEISIYLLGDLFRIQ